MEMAVCAACAVRHSVVAEVRHAAHVPAVIDKAAVPVRMSVRIALGAEAGC